jgi:hypothetical protein
VNDSSDSGADSSEGDLSSQYDDKTPSVIDKGIGYISSKYEGKADSVHHDNIGWAYGKYQFNTTGGLPNFLRDNPEYAAMLAEGGAPGSKGFGNKWQEIARSKEHRAGFLAAQEVSGRKNYLNPAMAKAKSLGFDTNSRAVQEALFSGAVQHGKWNSIVLPDVAKNSDLSKMTPEQQVHALYEGRRRYGDRLGGALGADVKGRTTVEEPEVIKLARAEAHQKVVTQGKPKVGNPYDDAHPSYVDYNAKHNTGPFKSRIPSDLISAGNNNELVPLDDGSYTTKGDKLPAGAKDRERSASSSRNINLNGAFTLHDTSGKPVAAPVMLTTAFAAPRPQGVMR